MAKKVIRTQNSDGTWSETTQVRKPGGCAIAFAWVFGSVFVIAIAIQYPWMWALYGILLILAIYGGYKKRQEQK